MGAAQPSGRALRLAEEVPALKKEWIARHDECRLWPRLGRRSGVREFLTELWAFARERKKFWLLPIVAVLLVLGLLIALTQVTAIAPFIYTLF